MGVVVVWGKSRDLIKGDPPYPFPVEEADTFADVRSQINGKGSPLILADPIRLVAEREAVEAWVKAGGALEAALVAVAEPGEADELLRRLPYLDDLALRPVTPARLRFHLERLLEVVHSRQVIHQLEAALTRKGQDLHELNKIGVALSAERDIGKLLQLILAKSRQITAADAGSLYLVERGGDDGATSDDRLRFKLAQNDSVMVSFEELTMPLDESSIAGYAALTGHEVNVADAYDLPPHYPFKVGRSFDQRSGYRSKSMLVVPMRDHLDQVIGVVQLINKKRDARVVLRPVALVDEAVIPFTAVDEELVTSLASQAAVAFENTLLIQGIRNLFDSFVGAAVTAIEQRDPTTSGHSGRVAVLTVGLAEVVDTLGTGRFREVRFSRDQIQELKYASLLHDFGKVGVREKVLIKGKKLYVGEMLVVRQRFAYVKRTLEAQFLRAKLEQIEAGAPAATLAAIDHDYQERCAELDVILKMILAANEPSILEEESFRTLMDLPKRTYLDIEGNRQPYLTPNEVSALSIRRGSLSEKERREIESHVTHTFEFLSQIPWTGEFKQVPDIAFAHHEKLDGSGYPRGLKSEGIPLQSKMMTISDIYDALVAWDRPYKKSLPVERALDILKEEAGQGKLDRELLEIFVGSKLYERTLGRPGSEAASSR
jgi:HD-GYP domain-containing protein (c-di-GMP phosphodiesterase class II)